MRTRWIALAALAMSACGDDDEGPSGSNMDAAVSPADGAAPDAQLDASAPPDCYTNPGTYLEIINACTSAEKIAKRPVLPLLGADGKLPPLP